ncbi:hypothetical protein ACHAQJ_008068 [Trichoderma viride]
MHSISLTILGFVAGSPLVHADVMGGYVKSMFQSHPPVTQSEAPMDPRLYSIWSSFHKIYQEVEHAATTTTSSYPTSTSSDVVELPTSEQYVTIVSSESYLPAPAPTEEATLYSTVSPISVPAPVPETTSSAVDTSPVVSVSSTVQPSQNSTVTSTGRSTTSSTKTKGTSRPTKVPPPLNGVSKDAAPVMGAVVVAIAGCLMF